MAAIFYYKFLDQRHKTNAIRRRNFYPHDVQGYYTNYEKKKKKYITRISGVLKNIDETWFQKRGNVIKYNSSLCDSYCELLLYKFRIYYTDDEKCTMQHMRERIKCAAHEPMGIEISIIF